MKLLRVWSFEFGGRSNYRDIIWLHRFLYCAVRTSCCFSRNWSGRRNHPVWQVYVIDDQQTWTSGQKAMSHIAKTSQQFTYNFQWIHFFQSQDDSVAISSNCTQPWHSEQDLLNIENWIFLRAVLPFRIEPENKPNTNACVKHKCKCLIPGRENYSILYR